MKLDLGPLFAYNARMPFASAPRHPAGLFSVLAASLTLLCSQSAQAQTITATVRAFGDRTGNALNLPLGGSECEENVDITFRLENVPTDQPVLDIYWGTDCNLGTNRTNTTTENCFKIASQSINGNTGQVMVDISAVALECEDETATRTLFFLAVASEGAGGDVLPYGKLDFKIDTQPPSPPTAVSGGMGESTIPVEWESTASDVNEFIVYWDPADTDCSSELLVPGEPVDATNLSKKGDISTGARTTTISGAVAVGESTTVGVVAVDAAGNESVLSNVDCIVGINTVGWPELHAAQGGKLGDTCSVASMTRGHAMTLSMWAMLVLLVGLRAARRLS